MIDLGNGIQVKASIFFHGLLMMLSLNVVLLVFSVHLCFD